MEETIINSKKLWTETKETLDLDKLNKKSAKLAVRDQLNLKFSIQVFAFQAEKISLLAAGEELPPHMDQDIPQKLVDMEKHEPLRMHNSFMRLQGFDSVKDTPVEVLHKSELLALWFASIHSNRQSPSQDIAITFSSYHAFRQLLSGVINMFSQNPLIQQTLGYNHSASTQNINYPSVKKNTVPEIDRLVIHQPLRNVYAEHEVKQISEVNLNKKQVLKKKYFILFNINQSTGAPLIGRINSIWMVQKPGHQSSYFFHVTVFQN
ncbi:hypothetical protein H4Q26_013478 [Puccinia striiformis f. sp. tritici PST-130]|nr:hypothetical protein H4Q26_013478 [Puccinia striiformis f. sp. tritici PST-130]